MTSAPPELTTFCYLTDPETAVVIAERGFAAASVWSPLSTLTLLDRVPAGIVDGILLLRLPADAAREAVRNEAFDPGADYRKFLVPMKLLRWASITRHIR